MTVSGLEPMAKLRRLDTPAGDVEYEALKLAYIAAVDGDTPDETCEELHRKILAARPVKRFGAAAGAFQATTTFDAQASEAFLPAGAFDAQAAVQAAAAAASLTSFAASLAASSEGVPALGAMDAGSQQLATTTRNGPINLVALEDRDAARLFIGGLPNECTAEELRALVEQIPFSMQPHERQLLECRVLPNRGCGYMRFASWEAAQEAITALNERSVFGWSLPLRVRWATPKASLQGGSVMPQSQGLDQHVAAVSLQALLGAGGTQESTIGEEATVIAQGLDPKRLFVGQLTRDLTDKAILMSLFEPFGPIESLRWLEDKGIAYVQYAHFAGARNAVTALDGKHCPGISREQGLNVQFSKMR